MNTNSTFTGFYTETPFCYQQSNLRQSERLNGGQPIADVDTADNCPFYVTTMKPMNF